MAGAGSGVVRWGPAPDTAGGGDVEEWRMKLPRVLDPVEVRVVGALMEKERTTPDAYPLSLSALVAACNQRSARSPVMALGERDVEEALDRLHAEVCVWPVEGARVRRWRHTLRRKWELDDAAQAVMTVLLLRGAQTPGEIRTRTERMHRFGSVEEVEGVLEALASGEEPLVVQLERLPGQKESRWMHLAGGAPADAVAEQPPARPVRDGVLSERVHRLEERVALLEERLRRLEGSS